MKNLSVFILIKFLLYLPIWKKNDEAKLLNQVVKTCNFDSLILIQFSNGLKNRNISQINPEDFKPLEHESWN